MKRRNAERLNKLKINKPKKVPEIAKMIYLDYNSTTPLDKQVIKVMSKTMINNWANPSSDSEMGRRARAIIETSRHQVANMLGAEDKEIIFTSGGTEASNMIIRSAVEEFRQLGVKPHVITTTVEHDASCALLQHLKDNGKIDVTHIELNKNGTVSCCKILEAIIDRTCLITIMLANNETGIIFPVAEIGRELKFINKRRDTLGKIFLHTDAAQAIGKIPVNVNTLCVDYMTVVGHKFYGPRIGCVYRRTGCPLKPMLFGGGQEKGLRSGTENTMCIAGLGEAARIVSENIKLYETQQLCIRKYFEKRIQESFLECEAKVNFNEVEERLPNTISLCFVGKRGREVLKRCKLVIASTGAACHADQEKPSGILLQVMTHEEALGTVRLSIGRETTEDDIEYCIYDFMQALKDV